MGVSVIAEAQQSKPSAPLPVPQWIVDDARLVGRSFGEVGMMGVFVQLNEGRTGTGSGSSQRFPVGYIIQENACWDWVGAHNCYGYGVFLINGRKHSAHRVIYEREKGPVPPGKELDHLCRNRGCVNPAHLEPVTHRENVLRGVGPSALAAKRKDCINGHALDPSNTYRTPEGNRRCRICNASTAKAYRARKKESL